MLNTFNRCVVLEYIIKGICNTTKGDHSDIAVVSLITKMDLMVKDKLDRFPSICFLTWDTTFFDFLFAVLYTKSLSN